MGRSTSRRDSNVSSHCAPDDPAGLARALDGIADWEALAREARDHGLFTLLVGECERAGGSRARRTSATTAPGITPSPSVWHAHLLASLDVLGRLLSAAKLARRGAEGAAPGRTSLSGRGAATECRSRPARRGRGSRAGRRRARTGRLAQRLGARPRPMRASITTICSFGVRASRRSNCIFAPASRLEP